MTIEIPKLTVNEIHDGQWKVPDLDPAYLGPYTDDGPPSLRTSLAKRMLKTLGGGELALGPDLRVEGNWWLFWRP